VIDLSPEALSRALEWVEHAKQIHEQNPDRGLVIDAARFPKTASHFADAVEHLTNIEAILETLLKLAETKEKRT
jgi:hypothetical protein